MNLTKQQATAIFGSGAALARALGITRGAVSQWPDKLDQQRTAMVIGAAVQSGLALPPGFIVPVDESDTPAAA
ncbi:Cro/CI family transcriptional regulator [Burkholderia gladioli]|uniref:Cro/CI family transcriptional regulator n=1 Tax=Burkholderia gladioli TaxID=28095 RepID=UPI000F52BF04|nr:Cro/CI family transcriptional regulator [Burkholderia gladioli]